MEPTIKQLYLGGLWQYNQAGVRRVLEAAMKWGFEKAEFLYEADWNLFKVTCLDKDLEPIVDAFRRTEEEMEQELVDVDDIDQILNPELTVREDLSNDFISRVYDRNGTQHDLSEFDKFRCPPDFWKFDYARVWSELDDENITLRDLLDDARFKHLARLAQVEMSHDLTGKVVYIGGASQALVDAAARRLSALLDQMKLAQPKPCHVFYAEHYTDFTVDARSIPLISSALLRTTLLDPALFSLPERYTQLLKAGVSLRICPWDRHRAYTVSLFGPASEHPDRNSAPLQRPSGDFISWRYAAKRKDAPNTSAKLLAAPKTQVDAVAAWVHTQNTHAAGSTQGVVSQQQVSHTPGGRHSGAQLSLPNTNQPRNENLLADSDISRGITFHMAPLVPAPLSPPTSSQPQARSSTGLLLEACSQGDEIVERATDLGSGGRRDRSGSPHKSPRAVSKLPAPVPWQMQTGWEATETFMAELTNALSSVTEHGRARAGKVDLRVHFGRICSWGWDDSALAVNKEGEPSNGYQKADLIDVLDNKLLHRGGVLFTKILSIYGNDADFLTAQTQPDGMTLMWERLSRRVVYAFSCEALVGEGPPAKFVIDVDGSAPHTFRYSLRTEPDEIGKVYVHGLWRNWDLEAVLSCALDRELAPKYGPFADALLASIEIGDRTIGRPELTFEVDHSYSVAVVGVRTLHVARYQSPDRQSFLDICQVQEMAKSKGELAEGVTRYVASPARERPQLGIFSSWFEASISSARGEKLFTQNESLTLGEAAAWTTELLLKDGVFRSLFVPALDMLKTMDSVGHHNDNNIIKRPHADVHTPGSTSSPSKVYYW